MYVGMLMCFIFFILVIIFSFIQNLKHDNLNPNAFIIFAAVTSLAVLSLFLYYFYGRIKKKIRNQIETDSISVIIESPTFATNNLESVYTIENDQIYCQSIKDFENIPDISSTDLPNYYSAILLCAPLRLTRDRNSEVADISPPSYSSSILSAYDDFSPPSYNTIFQNNI